MNDPRLDRREFQKLTAAALSGLAAGSLLGCSSKPATQPGPAPRDLGLDKHLCRGLNECAGMGKGGGNACRGQGACATLEAHACGGQNECKGQGGCGEDVGMNKCKGKGGCHVPLMTTAWETLRKRRETEWSAQQMEFKAAPAKTE